MLVLLVATGCQEPDVVITVINNVPLKDRQAFDVCSGVCAQQGACGGCEPRATVCSQLVYLTPETDRLEVAVFFDEGDSTRFHLTNTFGTEKPCGAHEANVINIDLSDHERQMKVTVELDCPDEWNPAMCSPEVCSQPASKDPCP